MRSVFSFQSLYIFHTIQVQNVFCKQNEEIVYSLFTAFHPVLFTWSFNFEDEKKKILWIGIEEPLKLSDLLVRRRNRAWVWRQRSDRGEHLPVDLRGGGSVPCAGTRRGSRDTLSGLAGISADMRQGPIRTRKMNGKLVSYDLKLKKTLFRDLRICSG